MGIMKGMNGKYGKNGITDIRPTEVFPTKQVIHNQRQVKCPDELEVGKTYQEMHKINNKPSNTMDLVEIVSIGGGKITVKSLKFSNLQTTYLADLGIIPYSENCWNPANYLMPSKSRLA